MSKLRQNELDADGHAKERVMLEWILDNAKAFYRDPKNIQAFETWKKNKEDDTYGAKNYANT